MKVCVVVPSDQHKETAGSRIRYGRLAGRESLSDLQLKVLTAAECAEERGLPHDVYVFSKTYGAIPALLGERIRDAGKLVGIDIFDDYFTQYDDVRLQGFRLWLEANAALFQFALCSTQRISDVLRDLLPGVPAFIIPDPGPPVDLRRLSKALDRKLDAALASRQLEMLWFGNGSNPFFSVGLNDLTAYGEALAALRRDGWGVVLTILTDAASLQPHALAKVARLPVPVSVVEWSLERETEALERSFASFIPVNAGSFSRAKSLNRAVSALCAGSQVLSTGFPLYEELAGFVYQSAEELLADLGRHQLKLSASSLATFSEAISVFANGYESAEGLLAFLSGLKGQTRGTAGAPGGEARLESGSSMRSLLATGFPLDLAVLHGAVPDSRVHRLARSIGALSIKGPFMKGQLDFDARFDIDETGGQVDVLVRNELLDHVNPRYRAKFSSVGRIGKVEMARLPPEIVEGDFQLARTLPRRRVGELSELQAYEDVMKATVAACAMLFPNTRIRVSELGNLYPRSF